MGFLEQATERSGKRVYTLFGRSASDTETYVAIVAIVAIIAIVVFPGQCTAGKLTHGVILRHRGRAGQTRAHADDAKHVREDFLAALLAWPGPVAWLERR
jgi:hypothetical protein